MASKLSVEKANGRTEPYDNSVVAKRISTIFDEIGYKPKQGDIDDITGRTKRLVEYLFNPKVTTGTVNRCIKQAIYKSIPKLKDQLI